MAVIVTGMEMPGKCADCKLTYLDTGDDAYFGANEYRCVIDDSVIDCNASEKAYDCPLKSVEGMIKKIEQHQKVISLLKGLSGDVLVCGSDGIEVGFRAETEPYFYCAGGYYIEPKNVLAWMPLPLPPEYKESEE